ncbi:hypothetical protein FA95DRAFT_770614 [Auriscalpium vulgare]|uniref:Uncharacterized protein n=1 Tax=Auriscalpium vulgare TaxID=40419 RepID=A0ACB8RB04_9AGAM|nr:hypothetical protein FA95DRAFT_770614 [Auriscalpium vulgare]
MLSALLDAQQHNSHLPNSRLPPETIGNTFTILVHYPYSPRVDSGRVRHKDAVPRDAPLRFWEGR